MISSFKLVLGFAIVVASGAGWCQTWQQANTPVVRLGIRDKLNEHGRYTAIFSVQHAGGEVRTKAVVVEPRQFGYVLFPDDFSSHAAVGHYSWKATVGGKDVAEGRFEVGVNASGHRLVIPWMQGRSRSTAAPKAKAVPP
jgi:hypothetical protein